MDKREIKMYAVKDIVDDLLRKVPIKKIAGARKVSKNTVRKYRDKINNIIAENPELTDSLDCILKEIQRTRREEHFSENFGWLNRNSELIEELSTKCDNYVRLVEVLHEHGFRGSYSSLLRYLTNNRIQSERPIMRIETKPGEIAQVDFGHIGKIYDEETKEFVKAYVFVLVLAYSRDAYYEIVKSQNVETWCNCHVHAFEHFGGVPGVVMPDNLKSAIIKASFMDPIANRSYADLARHYNFQIDPCLPGTPEHKGKVESGVKYVKNNFIPCREFKNFTDANTQLSSWNEKKARLRIHGTTRRQPKELFEEYEHETLRPLPHDRFEVPLWKEPKVCRDIHIQMDYAYYSVPYELRGERVWARKTTSQIAIFYENTLVAVHSPAIPGQRRTNPHHYPPDAGTYMKWDTNYCLSTADGIGEKTRHVIEKLLLHDPMRNLRSAQNILRMANKYEKDRLEEACALASHFGNYTYMGIKNILEKELYTHCRILSESELKSTHNKLDASYARDISQIIH